MQKPGRIVVIGVGNLLLKDEGVGVHVAHELLRVDLPQHIKVVDGGTSPEILEFVDPGEKLVIIDAIEANDTPGSVYRFNINDIETKATEFVSVHDLSLISRIKILQALGKGPEEVVIIGVQPKAIEPGTTLTPEIQQKLPNIIAVVLRELDINQPQKEVALKVKN